MALLAARRRARHQGDGICPPAQRLLAERAHEHVLALPARDAAEDGYHERVGRQSQRGARLGAIAPARLDGEAVVEDEGLGRAVELHARGA